VKRLIAIAVAGWLVVVVAFTNGCASNDTQRADRDHYNRLRRPSILPEHAENYVWLGRGWCTFDMEVQGKKRTFLHFQHDTGSLATEGVTEINTHANR
jgi:hypothetical protein